VDDEIATAGTLVAQVATLQSRGAKEIYACCTHPVLSGPAIERLAASPVKEVVVTDTVPVPVEKRIDKLTVLSIAPLIGEAIRRIHSGEPVEAMFE
jgi:ribose-phosphate pyrophosphokinase